MWFPHNIHPEQYIAMYGTITVVTLIKIDVPVFAVKFPDCPHNRVTMAV